MGYKAKPFCGKGHEQNEINSYFGPDGRRHCRRCRDLREEKRKAANPIIRRTLAERLWAMVDKTPGQGPWGDCWLFTGCINGGYGVIGLPNSRNTAKAHRVSFELANGAIDAALEVMHSCDTPACVNPSHLSQGTHAENMADMSAKGRAAGLGIRRDKCAQGHEYTIENSYFNKKTGKRHCAICAKAQDHARRMNRKMANTGATYKAINWRTLI